MTDEDKTILDRVANFVLDQASVVDGSVIYYSSSASEFKADANQTLTTIVDGGSF